MLDKGKKVANSHNGFPNLTNSFSSYLPYFSGPLNQLFTSKKNIISPKAFLNTNSVFEICYNLNHCLNGQFKRNSPMFLVWCTVKVN